MWKPCLPGDKPTILPQIATGPLSLCEKVTFPWTYGLSPFKNAIACNNYKKEITLLKTINKFHSKKEPAFYLISKNV